MMGFFDSLCGCFPQGLKNNIIQYLSSANLNRQLIEQEKSSEGNQAPEQSIYKQVKTKSYYFMKLQNEQEGQRQPQQSTELPTESYDQALEPNYYPKLEPSEETFNQLYIKKLAALQKILSIQVGPQYSKIYDSQDDLNLRIYCKAEIYQNKRYNTYRFSFDILHTENSKLTPREYANISLGGDFNRHEPLLNKKQLKMKTNTGLSINHLCYKKILVIQQHQFYTAEKCELVEEDGEQIAYNTVFSVRGQWQKQVDHNQGWIYLNGLKVSLQTTVQEQSTSLRQTQKHLHFEGYINIDLDITVNANMLKQPIAKEIRVYVQKVVCSLTKTDAI